MSERVQAATSAEVAVLVERLRLTDIRLKNLVARGEPAALLRDTGELAFGIQTRVLLLSVDDEGVHFEMGVRAWAPQATAMNEAPIFVQADRVVTYAGASEDSTAATLDHFMRTSVPLAAWPYLRGDVHRVCLDMDVPPFLLPLVKSPPFAETASIVAEGASVPDESPLRHDLVHALSELDDFLDERHAASIAHLAPTEGRDAWRDLLADTLLDAHALAVGRLSEAATSTALSAGLAQAERVVGRIERAMRLRQAVLREQHPEALLRWNEFAREWEALLSRAARSGLREGGRLPKLARFKP